MRDMTVVDYDPSWPAAYEAEIDRLRAVLDDVIVRTHHIGSTAVPGLAAKPVIDVLLEVRDLDSLDAHDEAMREIGYEPRGEFGIPGRRYYTRRAETGGRTTCMRSPSGILTSRSTSRFGTTCASVPMRRRLTRGSSGKPRRSTDTTRKGTSATRKPSSRGR